MRIGVQGEIGSACDAAAVSFQEQRFPDAELVYLTDASRVLAALDDGNIDAAMIAVESPIGVSVPETAAALQRHRGIVEVAELRSEVAHCLMIREDAENVRVIASHPIVLAKHREFLEGGIPGYTPLEVADPGLAAKQLADGALPPDTAVIALPRAAEAYGLKILDVKLPTNEGYLTRFVVVKKAQEQ